MPVVPNVVQAAHGCAACGMRKQRTVQVGCAMVRLEQQAVVAYLSIPLDVPLADICPRRSAAETCATDAAHPDGMSDIP